MRLLHLCWTHLPLRFELARHASSTDLVVVGGQPWDPGTVLDCSPGLRRLGVRPGQPLGSAHKLVPEATFLPADPPAYRAAWTAALERLAQFTPAVEASEEPEARDFGRALLGIEGLERLWGDEATLVARVASALAPLLPGAPRAGIGNARFAARVAATRGGETVRAGAAAIALGRIPRGDAAADAAWLAPLPIGLLTGDEEIRSRFRLFGLTRIGEFAVLARSAVLARFGSIGGELHDLARGIDARPLVPRRPIERLAASAELDPPVDSLEPVRFLLHRLAGALCEQLAARGAGAARTRLVLELESAPALHIDQPLPEPVASAALVERLLVARLEREPPGDPVVRITLELDGTAPAAGEQLGLFVPQEALGARLEWQLASLAIRFGSDRLWRPRLADPDALLAQGRVAWRPVADDTT
jgi:hypothetical protein